MLHSGIWAARAAARGESPRCGSRKQGDCPLTAIGTFSLFLALFLCGCTSFGPTAAQPTKSSFASFEDELAQELVDDANQFGTASIEMCFLHAYRTYVEGRIVEVVPADCEPATFGPWYAEKDYHATDARADGSLTEWDNNYFITHEWSPIGQQILSLIPGDVVTVNGMDVQIEGIFNYPKDSVYNEITMITGDDSVVFQTCYPDSNYNRIAYGKETVL